MPQCSSDLMFQQQKVERSVSAAKPSTCQNFRIATIPPPSRYPWLRIQHTTQLWCRQQSCPTWAACLLSMAASWGRLPWDLLQTRLCTPFALTKDLHWHWYGTQKLIPSRRPVPTLTASSSSLKPQEVIGIAKSQSPLCGEDAAKKKLAETAKVTVTSTTARSARTPGLSQKGCLEGSESGSAPRAVDQAVKYDCKCSLTQQTLPVAGHLKPRL